MKHRNTKRYQQEFTGKPSDLERSLIVHISNTGRKQIERRTKAGYSVYYSRDGVIVEVRPDKTEIVGKKVASKWIRLAENKRIIILK